MDTMQARRSKSVGDHRPPAPEGGEGAEPEAMVGEGSGRRK